MMKLFGAVAIATVVFASGTAFAGGTEFGGFTLNDFTKEQKQAILSALGNREKPKFTKEQKQAILGALKTAKENAGSLSDAQKAAIGAALSGAKGKKGH